MDSKFEEWNGCGVDRDVSSNGETVHVSRLPEVVIFSDSQVSRAEHIQNITAVENHGRDGDDELTNAQNDAILHRLVHTKLLSGSLNPELNLTPAQRRKALAGRVLELSGGAKVGKGEKAVRAAERNKASQRVRAGLLERGREKVQERLEQAKNFGNYHPTIKKIFESSSTAISSTRKRDRGLKMGVGRFSKGTLKLSRRSMIRPDSS